jgi:DNA-binding winged helix-turn-helix (wHTH) protein
VNFRFGPFTLDARARQLCRGADPVHLSPKAFDLLALLVRRRPEAISKAEVHNELWPGTFVSDVSLAVLVTEIRAALGEEARRPQFVRTVHRFGYAFSGTAVEVEQSRAASPAVTYWLAWDGERALLAYGENVIGREPTADICIDAFSISRRHALIVVTDEGVTIRDLESKNGTYLDDVRVTSPVPLIDGAEIRLGSAPVRFRRLTGGASTQTAV